MPYPIATTLTIPDHILGGDEELRYHTFPQWQKYSRHRVLLITGDLYHRFSLAMLKNYMNTKGARGKPTTQVVEIIFDGTTLSLDEITPVLQNLLSKIVNP